jgi:hypothetical protein
VEGDSVLHESREQKVKIQKAGGRKRAEGGGPSKIFSFFF